MSHVYDLHNTERIMAQHLCVPGYFTAAIIWQFLYFSERHYVTDAKPPGSYVESERDKE